LRDCDSVSFLAPELTDESDEDAPPAKSEVLEGLHAKLFVIDRGWNASVFSGSFNATAHALQHNVEFMVELVGRKSQCGVDQFLRQAKGETNFADLLKPYDVDAPPVPADATAQQLDDLLQTVKRAIDAAGPRLIVTPADEADLFAEGECQDERVADNTAS
jgi:phosphatidylserine/phosphatidylglycerophosphate/cardiolipin synthase-like enzyme